MQCPKCQRENFETDKPCPQCGFQGDASRLDELGHLQWLVNQMEKWEKLNIDQASVSKLKEIYSSYLKDTQVGLGLYLPFTPEEAKKTAEKAWIELSQLETLFEKVEEWRTASYFNKEMASLDPVKGQRAYAEELRQQLEKYQRPELLQTDQHKLKTVSFLLDQIDLLASRGWFKKGEIEKIVAPIMAVMLDIISDNQSE